MHPRQQLERRQEGTDHSTVATDGNAEEVVEGRGVLRVDVDEEHAQAVLSLQLGDAEDDVIRVEEVVLEGEVERTDVIAHLVVRADVSVLPADVADVSEDRVASLTVADPKGHGRRGRGEGGVWSALDGGARRHRRRRWGNGGGRR